MKSDLPAPDHASEFSFQGPVSEVSLWIIRNLPGQRSFDSKSLRQCLQVPLWKGGRSLRQLALTGNVLIYPDWSSIHVSLVQKPALFFFFSDFPHRSPASKSLPGLQREKNAFFGGIFHLRIWCCKLMHGNAVKKPYFHGKFQCRIL